LTNSIKRSINEAPKNNGEMKEGREREGEREDPSQVQAERMEPKVHHNKGIIVETLMFQNLVPQSQEAHEKKKGMRNL
jgi:hypothetical protein